MMRTWHKAAACMTLATCVSTIAGIAPAGAAPVFDRLDRDTDWRRVATIADRGRLRGWREAWIGALAQVDPREIKKEPVLFDPDRSLADPLPPPGNYRCRTFKLGSRAGIGPTFMASGWFACRIGGSVDRGGDGDREDVDGGGNSVVSLTKLDGSQRPVGTIFADTNARAIFLGTMELGDEKRPMRYGRDATRDMAGLIERIGTKRWRVVLPYPKFESVLDVVELVPAD